MIDMIVEAFGFILFLDSGGGEARGGQYASYICPWSDHNGNWDLIAIAIAILSTDSQPLFLPFNLTPRWC